MSWGRQGWGDSAKKASDFLNTGGFNDVVRNVPEFGVTELKTECVQSDQCGSGFGCVNGQCVQLSGGYTSGGSGSGNISSPTINPGSAAGCDPDDPDSVCGSMTGANNCSKPGCDNDGKIPDPEDCCGERCCRFSGAGVECFCGPCPPPTGCSAFCTDYFASNGQIAAGCATGPEGNTCDECQYCDVLHFDGQCQPKSIKPCWCDEGRGCGDCERCDREPSSFTYGDCVSAPGTCQSCATVYNYPCDCGQVIPQLTACKNVDESGPVAATLLQEEITRACEAKCDGVQDPCKGVCTSRTYEGTPPACPAGYACTTTGSISGGGQTYTLREECDVTNVPEQCKECDCNCHNDCPECQICGSDGVCREDPACVCDDQPEFQHGCGTYVVSYTVHNASGPYRACSDDRITTPALEDSSITGTVTLQGCGMRYEITTSTLTQSCGALDTSGGVPIDVFAVYKQETLDGPWVLASRRTGIDGHWFNQLDYIDGEKTSTVEVTGVTFDGSPIQPTQCFS